MFIDPGVAVYQGMVIGEHSRGNDLEVNVLKGKQITNIRAAGKDEAVRLTPPRKMSLEQAIAYIEEDELVEITRNRFGCASASSIPRTASGPRSRRRTGGPSSQVFKLSNRGQALRSKTRTPTGWKTRPRPSRLCSRGPSRKTRRTTPSSSPAAGAAPSARIRDEREAERRRAKEQERERQRAERAAAAIHKAEEAARKAEEARLCRRAGRQGGQARLPYPGGGASAVAGPQGSQGRPRRPRQVGPTAARRSGWRAG